MMFLFMVLFIISGLVMLVGLIGTKISEVKEEGLSRGNIAVIIYFLVLMLLAK